MVLTDKGFFQDSEAFPFAFPVEQATELPVLLCTFKIRQTQASMSHRWMCFSLTNPLFKREKNLKLLLIHKHRIYEYIISFPCRYVLLILIKKQAETHYGQVVK